MQPLQANRPYVHFLLINGSIALGLWLLYKLGQVLESVPLLLFVLLACLWPVLKVLLGSMAAARRQWLPAFLYGLVSVALFFADRWLLEQFE